MANFCSHCGKPISEGAAFCDSCGARLTDAPDTQQGQAPVRQYSQPSQNVPNRQANQPYPQNAPRQTGSKTGLIVGLSVGGAATITFIIILIFVLFPLFKTQEIKPLPTEPTFYTEATLTPTEKPTEPPTQPTTAAPTQAPTQAPTKAPTQPPTQAPTQAPTKAPTQPQTQAPTKAAPQPKAKLPYVDSLGSIKDTDFAWISDAMSGGMQGKFLSRDEFVGKWKAEFVFDGIWELVYITIDTDGTVTVQPYQINYGSGWEYEANDPSYTFNCSFDIDRVFGSGVYGSIDLYQFIKSGDKQYAQGTLNAKTGYKARVYLVRP